ncbi:MAG: hypothetical protein ACI89L_000783 [Phycisphaerales bacterium]|jgi:hypothetical protein
MAHTTPISLLLAAAMTPAALAQPISASFDAPSGDRWNYPFNATPGYRSVATIFGAPDVGPGFDDRDAQFIISFDTGAQIPAGELSENYQVSSIRLTAYIAAGDQAAYDTSYDSYRSHLLEGDPDLQIDADAGRPVELFGTGYRNGWDLATWTEFTVFGGPPAVEPVQGARNIFPAGFAPDGSASDQSNQVKERREVLPVAIGTVAGLTPGLFIPQDAAMVFDVTLTDPGFVTYVQQSLAAGRINMAISGMAFAIGGPDGGSGDPQYPAFYTNDDALANVLGLVPTLEITVEIGSPIDFNGDGILDNGDIGAFIGLFLAGDLTADVNGDGILDNGDIGSFIELFLAAAG